MLKLHFILAFLVLAPFVSAQELISNGSFESYYTCPAAVSDFDSVVKNWRKPTLGTPDYFNICATYQVNVPNTVFGFQNPRTGNAFAGFYTYRSDNYYEYIYSQLVRPLKRDSTYDFEMWVNVCDTFRITASNIGAYFSGADMLDTTKWDYFNVTPQIANPSGRYPDRHNWTRVNGTFRAAGGEQYVIIGNFQPRSQADTALSNPSIINFPANFVYTYVDDVSLRPSFATRVDNALSEQYFTLSPHPFVTDLIVKAKDEKEARISIYDLNGKKVFEQLFKKRANLNLSHISPGIYHYRLQNAEGENQRGTTVKQ